MSESIFMVCCLILVIVPLVFVSSKVYKDGFFGRCGLLGIAFSAATFLLEWLGGEHYEMLEQTVFLVVSFTVFLCWHLFRFHNRVVMEKSGRAHRDQWKRAG